MNDDELLELIADLGNTITDSQKLTIARALIKSVSDKKILDSDKKKKLLLASELIRMFV
jgi:hypothetical protein